ncbi:phosphoacetylglucosamine mutase [Impatiens glandulifera]|uniref:phosphoacetylglucosamine mutase n=1 Tax=Impatiens glandulifera TaxID=253017 RepID=UPI001FB0835C|nr:phosphoacetylglucosamine mutase [Impatiens glandulifera]
MNDKQRSILLDASASFLPPPGTKLSYGTSGFREDASLLESTMFRMGILAALRSLKTKSVIGLMITASHNKVSDNGVKIADPSGGMLSQDWEPFADSLANSPDPQHLVQLLDEFMKKENILLNEGECSAEILLARDTRPSGARLLQATMQGIKSVVGAIAVDMGILTTPQLHWMVRARNMGNKASELDYFHEISTSFRSLIDLIPTEGAKSKTNDKLIIDGANGVGGDKLESLVKMINGFDVEIRNTGKEGGVLNEEVGADYVQKEKVTPQGFDMADVGTRCASLDGDADRLVYFYIEPKTENKIILVDGDKMLSLFALFILDQLKIIYEDDDEEDQIRLGVVQTAYANGASTAYLKFLGLEVVLTPTGVKYLHEKADEFDIGIYFEANGHGTVLFSDATVEWLEKRNRGFPVRSRGSEQQKAVLRLLAVSKLINQAVGDALSGLLLVEAILLHMGWSIHRWNELYQDLPSRQLKVKVVDRTAIVTANAETVAVEPSGIQDAINTEVAKYPNGRCFIRPSGTEDVVRVYAEASRQEEADDLAKSVAQIVDRFLGFGH